VVRYVFEYKTKSRAQVYPRVRGILPVSAPTDQEVNLGKFVFFENSLINACSVS
jgi:hypothetical protein